MWLHRSAQLTHLVRVLRYRKPMRYVAIAGVMRVLMLSITPTFYCTFCPLRNPSLSHEHSPRILIGQIRTWLRTASKRTTIPGGEKIWERFQQFQQELPAICHELHIQVTELTFVDYRDFVAMWLKENTL